jgi:hypothetical protein
MNKTKQNSYHVTLRRLRVTIVDLKMQMYYILFVFVCSLKRPVDCKWYRAVFLASINIVQYDSPQEHSIFLCSSSRCSLVMTSKYCWMVLILFVWPLLWSCVWRAKENSPLNQGTVQTKTTIHIQQSYDRLNVGEPNCKIIIIFSRLDISRYR